ncbi:MAG TPA: hypothetical protein PKJ71_03460 [Bacteroidales bacterium]|nr:hypothetical protein [Bacteroidales bacterium]
MKRLYVMLFTALLASAVVAQETKTGWNFGALPAVTYSTDQGFQYGALVNLFDYGDGSIYPDYYHRIYIEASTFTKGSSILRIMYDSDYLIKGIRYAVDLSYMPDFAYDFYGFNGFGSVYVNDWTNDDLNAPPLPQSTLLCHETTPVQVQERLYRQHRGEQLALERRPQHPAVQTGCA